MDDFLGAFRHAYEEMVASEHQMAHVLEPRSTPGHMPDGWGNRSCSSGGCSAAQQQEHNASDAFEDASLQAHNSMRSFDSRFTLHTTALHHQHSQTAHSLHSSQDLQWQPHANGPPPAQHLKSPGIKGFSYAQLHSVKRPSGAHAWMHATDSKPSTPVHSRGHAADVDQHHQAKAQRTKPRNSWLPAGFSGQDFFSSSSSSSDDNASDAGARRHRTSSRGHHQPHPSRSTGHAAHAHNAHGRGSHPGAPFSATSSLEGDSQHHFYAPSHRSTIPQHTTPPLSRRGSVGASTAAKSEQLHTITQAQASELLHRGGSPGRVRLFGPTAAFSKDLASGTCLRGSHCVHEDLLPPGVQGSLQYQAVPARFQDERVPGHATGAPSSTAPSSVQTPTHSHSGSQWTDQPRFHTPPLPRARPPPAANYVGPGAGLSSRHAWGGDSINSNGYSYDPQLWQEPQALSNSMAQQKPPWAQGTLTGSFSFPQEVSAGAAHHLFTAPSAYSAGLDAATQPFAFEHARSSGPVGLGTQQRAPSQHPRSASARSLQGSLFPSGPYAPPQQEQQQQAAGVKAAPGRQGPGHNHDHVSPWTGRGAWGSTHASRDSTLPTQPGLPPWQQRAAALDRMAGSGAGKAATAQAGGGGRTAPERSRSKGSSPGRKGTAAGVELRNTEQEFLAGLGLLWPQPPAAALQLSGPTAYSNQYVSESLYAQGQAPAYPAAAGLQASMGTAPGGFSANYNQQGGPHYSTATGCSSRHSRHSRSGGGAGRRPRKESSSLQEAREGPERLIAIIDAVRTSAGGGAGAGGSVDSRNVNVLLPSHWAGSPAHSPIQSHVNLAAYPQQGVHQVTHQQAAHHPQQYDLVRHTSGSQLLPDMPSDPNYSSLPVQRLSRQPSSVDSEALHYPSRPVSPSAAAFSPTSMHSPPSPAGLGSVGFDLAAMAGQLAGMGITDPQLLRGFAEGFIDGRLEAYPQEFAQVRPDVVKQAVVALLETALLAKAPVNNDQLTSRQPPPSTSAPSIPSAPVVIPSTIQVLRSTSGAASPLPPPLPQGRHQPTHSAASSYALGVSAATGSHMSPEISFAGMRSSSSPSVTNASAPRSHHPSDTPGSPVDAAGNVGWNGRLGSSLQGSPRAQQEGCQAAAALQQGMPALYQGTAAAAAAVTSPTSSGSSGTPPGSLHSTTTVLPGRADAPAAGLLSVSAAAAAGFRLGARDTAVSDTSLERLLAAAESLTGSLTSPPSSPSGSEARPGSGWGQQFSVRRGASPAPGQGVVRNPLAALAAALLSNDATTPTSPVRGSSAHTHRRGASGVWSAASDNGSVSLQQHHPHSRRSSVELVSDLLFKPTPPFVAEGSQQGFSGEPMAEHARQQDQHDHQLEVAAPDSPVSGVLRREATTHKPTVALSDSEKLTKLEPHSLGLMAEAFESTSSRSTVGAPARAPAGQGAGPHRAPQATVTHTRTLSGTLERILADGQSPVPVNSATANLARILSDDYSALLAAAAGDLGSPRELPWLPRMPSAVAAPALPMPSSPVHTPSAAAPTASAPLPLGAGAIYGSGTGITPALGQGGSVLQPSAPSAAAPPAFTAPTSPVQVKAELPELPGQQQQQQVPLPPRPIGISELTTRAEQPVQGAVVAPGYSPRSSGPPATNANDNAPGTHTQDQQEQRASLLPSQPSVVGPETPKVAEAALHTPLTHQHRMQPPSQTPGSQAPSHGDAVVNPCDSISVLRPEATGGTTAPAPTQTHPALQQGQSMLSSQHTSTGEACEGSALRDSSRPVTGQATGLTVDSGNSSRVAHTAPSTGRLPAAGNHDQQQIVSVPLTAAAAGHPPAVTASITPSVAGLGTSTHNNNAATAAPLNVPSRSDPAALSHPAPSSTAAAAAAAGGGDASPEPTHASAVGLVPPEHTKGSAVAAAGGSSLIKPGAKPKELMRAVEPVIAELRALKSAVPPTLVAAFAAAAVGNRELPQEEQVSLPRLTRMATLLGQLHEFASGLEARQQQQQGSSNAVATRMRVLHRDLSKWAAPMLQPAGLMALALGTQGSEAARDAASGNHIGGQPHSPHSPMSDLATRRVSIDANGVAPATSPPHSPQHHQSSQGAQQPSPQLQQPSEQRKRTSAPSLVGPSGQVAASSTAAAAAAEPAPHMQPAPSSYPSSTPALPTQQQAGRISAGGGFTFPMLHSQSAVEGSAGHSSTSGSSSGRGSMDRSSHLTAAGAVAQDPAGLPGAAVLGGADQPAVREVEQVAEEQQRQVQGPTHLAAAAVNTAGQEADIVAPGEQHIGQQQGASTLVMSSSGNGNGGCQDAPQEARSASSSGNPASMQPVQGALELLPPEGPTTLQPAAASWQVQTGPGSEPAVAAADGACDGPVANTQGQEQEAPPGATLSQPPGHEVEARVMPMQQEGEHISRSDSASEALRPHSASPAFGHSGAGHYKGLPPDVALALNMAAQKAAMAAAMQQAAYLPATLGSAPPSPPLGARAGHGLGNGITPALGVGASVHQPSAPPSPALQNGAKPAAAPAVGSLPLGMQMYAGMSLPDGFPVPFVAGGGLNHTAAGAVSGAQAHLLPTPGVSGANGSLGSNRPLLGHSASMQVTHTTRHSDGGQPGQDKLKKSMSLKAKLTHIFGGGKGKDKQ